MVILSRLPFLGNPQGELELVPFTVVQIESRAYCLVNFYPKIIWGFEVWHNQQSFLISISRLGLSHGDKEKKKDNHNLRAHLTAIFIGLKA